MADSLPFNRERQPLHLLPSEGLDSLGVSLPAPLTSLVGREREAPAVAELLQSRTIRLVTLTGPGGVGKTRLALRVAADLAGEFPDGVVFVPLAPISNPALVLSAIAQALAVREVGRRPLPDVLAAFLRERRLLLLLDNFEQVVHAGPSITALLAACPDLNALVTSRIALRVLGEQEFPVPPLVLPDQERLPPLEELARTEAVALFVQRMQAVRPGFALTAETAPIVAEICRRLDGLPLAIELAAARGKVLSPAALAARLTNRLQVLTSGPHDQPARLQTMRAAVDWSYNLLTDEEQGFFRRLAVFVGGCTLEAADVVAGKGVSGLGGMDDDLIPAYPLTPLPASPDVLDLVTSLVDKSLLRRSDEGVGESRFWMLETIREYGLERLAEAGEEATMRRLHADWCLALAEECWPSFQRRLDAAEGVRRLAADHDNIRAALAWLESDCDSEALLRLVGAAFLFWYVRGRLNEGLNWLERALALGGEKPTPARARALIGSGMLAHFAADDARAIPRLEESLRVYRLLADPWGMAFSLVILGVAAEDAGDYDRANALLEEGLAHSRASDDATDIGLALFHLGVVAWGQGDVEQAVERLDEALAVQRAAGDLAYGAGESLAFLGLIACERGDLAQSVDLQRESLLLHLTIDSTEVLAVNLANVAMVAAATRRLNAAARLFGAAFALREVIGNPFKLPERAVYERAIGALRSALPEDAFAVAWQSERTFSLAEAAADAAAVLDEIGNEAATGGASQVHAAAVADGIASLTPRELEVLRLLVEGRSDREIAEALFISPRTAQGHVAHIFSKLDVSTRMAAVATAIRAGLVTDRRAAG